MKRFKCKKPEDLLKVEKLKPIIIDDHLWFCWKVFNDLSRQWRFRPMGMGAGVRIDLDATAVLAYIKAIKHKKPIKLYQQIQWIVQGVLEADYERTKRNNK